MSPQKKSTGRKLPLTEKVEEGPYYKAGSPERHVISGPDSFGNKLVITGRVLDRNGRPVRGAWLDFWQADGSGHYDNAGFKLRGHQFADASGEYRLETVFPTTHRPPPFSCRQQGLIRPE